MGERGGSWHVVLHVVLLFVLAGELVFLSARHRVRFDLTEESRYSLTDATGRILGRLEEPLRIEVYLTPDDQVGVRGREQRRTFRAVLDEYAQRGGGLVRVEYFDVTNDPERREKARRLGMRPRAIQDVEGRTLSQREIWQGLRFVYGGQAQRVIPYTDLTDRTAYYESLFTPKIAAVVQLERPKVGVAFWTDKSVRGAPGFEQLLALPQIIDRYELVPLEIGVRDRIPEDLDTVFLLGPRQLTPVQKYAFDQFLLRGGTLVAFVDGIDVSLANWPSMLAKPMAWDDQETLEKLSGLWVEQLRHYGIDVEGPGRTLVDLASTQVPLAVPNAGPNGRRGARPIDYPHWFQPLARDWSQEAPRIAQQFAGDPDLVGALARRLKPGIDKEATAGLVVPEMFWPVAVDAARKIPDGVEVRTLLRTSPYQALLTAGRTMSPFGTGGDWTAAYRSWFDSMRGRVTRELALGGQRGLLIEANGRFTSFFDGEPPVRPEDRAVIEASEQSGPPVMPEDDRTRLKAAEADGRLIVCGDTSFLRDDLTTNRDPTRGPVSRLGPAFFLSFLDWLVGDQDLIELRARRGPDRAQVFVDTTERNRLGPGRAAELERERVSAARLRNQLLPLLILFGGAFLMLLWRRRAGRATRRALLGAIQSKPSDPTTSSEAS